MKLAEGAVGDLSAPELPSGAAAALTHPLRVVALDGTPSAGAHGGAAGGLQVRARVSCALHGYMQGLRWSPEAC